MSHLTLYDNTDVTSSAWGAFAAVFQNPLSALEKIDLAYSIDNDALVSFADSLRHNSKLKELFIEANWEEEENITITNWDALSNLL